MNGAEALVDTLENNGIEVCFSNPGTSEMHVVAAINKSRKLRPVLALFEGVVTGAADGYGRMAEKPACTLLHLGPGLANGLANLHNAKRGSSPVVNIVGDHPGYHLHHDSPLTTDIASIARSVSHAVYTVSSVRSVGSDTARIIQEARKCNGQVATLILPANIAWEEHAVSSARIVNSPTSIVDENVIVSVASTLKKRIRTALLLRGSALSGEGLRIAGRIAAYTGATLLSDTFSPRIQRGVGLPIVQRLPYRSEDTRRFLEDFDQLVLVGGLPPVAFFAYPGKPSWPTPDNCRIVTLAHPHEDTIDALKRLDEASGIPKGVSGILAQFQSASLIRSDELTAENVMRVVGDLLPERAIICDESVSSGFPYYTLTANSRMHDYLQLTGGAIGSMLSASIGAAIACNDRKVICLIGDGSAMYTVQALWTMARERLDVIVLIYANQKYAILQEEMKRMGAENTTNGWPSMLDINDPSLSWVNLANSMGVQAERVKTTEQLRRTFQSALINTGPFVIEAMIC